eukprot:6484439-Amphidinium_carterae.1
MSDGGADCELSVLVCWRCGAYAIDAVFLARPCKGVAGPYTFKGVRFEHQGPARNAAHVVCDRHAYPQCNYTRAHALAKQKKHGK